MKPERVAALVIKAQTYGEIISFIIRNRKKLVQGTTSREAVLGKLVDELMAKAEEMSVTAMLETAKLKKEKGRERIN
jgi:hypothetical protein